MAEFQADLTADDIADLAEKMGQSKALMQTIKAQMARMTPEQFQDLNEKLLAKMTPEERAQAQEFGQGERVQIQIRPTLPLFASAQNDLLEAFNALGQRVKEKLVDKNLSITEEAAALTARTRTAKQIMDLQDAIVQEVVQQQGAARGSQIAPPARPPARGRGADTGSGTGQYL